MADGDALGLAGGAGGEDDPCVVLGAGASGGGTDVREAGGVDARTGAQHRPYSGLAEDQLGPLVRVLGVDRDVGGARGEDGEDGRVQLVGPGRDADADPVAEAHSGGREVTASALDLGCQRPIGQTGGPVVQGELVGVRPYGGLEDVDEGAGGGGGPGGEAGCLARLLVPVLVCEQSEFTALRCGCHRPSRLVPGNVRVAGGARVCPGCSGPRQTTHQPSAPSRIFSLKPCVWPEDALGPVSPPRCSGSVPRRGARTSTGGTRPALRRPATGRRRRRWPPAGRGAGPRCTSPAAGRGR